MDAQWDRSDTSDEPVLTESAGSAHADPRAKVRAFIQALARQTAREMATKVLQEQADKKKIAI